MLQVNAVDANDSGQLDVTAAIVFQPGVFAQGSASTAQPEASEPQQQEEQQQPVAPTAAQQHAGSIQVLTEHLRESQQASWQDGSPTAGSRDGGSRPDSPRGRAAYAGLRDAVFDIIAPRDWTAQLPDPPGACLSANVQRTASRACRTGRSGVSAALFPTPTCSLQHGTER